MYLLLLKGIKVLNLLTSFDRGYIKVAGVGVGTLPGLQRVGHGLQCKAEGQVSDY